jgi:FKBP-type peptidyl-prolyl cis-trans isomerase FkpA
MRTLVIWLTVLILATAVDAAADGPKLETEEQKTLYALGLTINRSLSPFNLSPSELELVEAGLADGSLHKTPMVDLETYGPKIKQIQEARAAAVAAAEKKTSQAFVDKAAREPGAMKTASAWS